MVGLHAHECLVADEVRSLSGEFTKPGVIIARNANISFRPRVATSRARLAIRRLDIVHSCRWHTNGWRARANVTMCAYRWRQGRECKPARTNIGGGLCYWRREMRMRIACLALVLGATSGVACRARNTRPVARSLSQRAAPVVHANPTVAIDGGDAGASFLSGKRPMVRVALIGDQGLGLRAQTVLDLIREASADFVVILGDFDYIDQPPAWLAQLQRLGRAVPWFALIGNHDRKQWSGYSRLIAAQQRTVEGARCSGTPGSQARCEYRGVEFILSGLGTIGDLPGHETFIRNSLNQLKSHWKLCLWHKTQHDMQVGEKEDEVGWDPYRACEASGAIVVTGHEHSYARTRTLTAIGDKGHGHGAIGPLNQLSVGPGRTFVAVSGLGGVETRLFSASHVSDTWWGAYFTANRQSANGIVTEENHELDGAGALFLDFGVDGDVGRGRGRFVTAFDHHVFDDFSIHFE